MANIKSAKKRIKVSKRRTEENRGKKTELLSAIKKFKALIAKGELEEATTYLKDVTSLIDSAASHGRLHKRSADRKKARLAKALDKAKKAAGVKEEKPVAKKEAKVEEKKEAKPAAKKTTAKKATTKKTTTAKKTSTAKKTTAKKEEA